MRIDPTTSPINDILHQIRYHEKMRDYYSGNARAKKSEQQDINWLHNLLKERDVKTKLIANIIRLEAQQ